jgi:NADH-quinone oxidoreductase subunit G
MSDSGRFLYKQVAAPDRLAAIRVDGAASSLDIAVNAAATLLKSAPGAVSIVGSGRASVEEQFALKQLATALGAQAHLVARTGQGDKLLISADRNPNVRGALVTGLISQLPCAELKQLSGEIDSGKIKVVISHGEDLVAAGLSPAQLAKVAIIYLGTHAHATSAAAKIVLPTLHTFEKGGTFVNQQFRIQKFAAAVPGPAGASNDLLVLSRLSAAAGGPALASDVHGLWPTIASSVPALGTMLYKNIPDTGLVLDATAWAALPFVEGETLHYKPAAAAVAAA